MFCPECGKGIEAGIAFCPECGAKISSTQTVSSINQVVKKPIKPMGIMVIIFYTAFWGIIVTLSGGIGLLGSQIGMGVLGEIGGGGPFGIGTGIGKTSTYVALIGLLSYLILFFGIFGMTAAYGLWSFTGWGRKLTVVIYILTIPLAFLSLIGQRVTFGLIVLLLVSIAVSVGIILYLSTPSVKKLYQ